MINSVKDRYYNPFNIGRNIYKNRQGLSDLIRAVKSDSDLEEASRGYLYEQERAQIKAKLAYSRVGLNNV